MYSHGHSLNKQAYAGSFGSRIAHLFALFIFVLIAPGAFAQVTHVTNPYAGAVNYLNPDYTGEIKSAIADPSTTATQAAQMVTLETYPTAVWLDHIGAINGSVPNASSSISRLGLQGHINAAKLQQADKTQNPSGLPIVVELMIYDLPGRDCAALASNGELTIPGGDTIIDSNGNPLTLTGTGLSEYENFYVTPIANILQTEANNPNIRFVLVVEDDSLPNLITNVGQSNGGAIQACVNANNGMTSAPSTAGVYVQAIQFALSTFHKIPNVYNYLDVGHHGWLGWQQNEQAAVPFFVSVAKGAGGVATVDGFITNTANYGPTTEPFMTANQAIGGQPVRGSNFYHFNQFIDEESYAADMDKQLIAAGFPATLGFLIDTSRNGWGSNLRPAAASTSTALETFVSQSKIDLRTDMGQWCNQPHAGMGAKPQVNPDPTGFANLSAFVWMKPPGESDGNYPGSNFGGVVSTKGDPNCDPTHNNSLANNMPSGAVPNSPHAGAFWLPYYQMLVQNAFPAIPPSGGNLGNGSFTLTPSSASLTLKAGATAADVITVTDSGGFTGAVTFTVGGLPTGVTPSFSTNPATSSTTLTLTAATTVASAGPITVTITGSGGGTTASTTVALTVIGNGGGFTLTPASTNLTVTAGGSTPDTITIADTGGFTGAVTLAVAGLPAGVTPTFSTNPATSTSTLTLTAASTAASAGPVTVTITGTSGTTTATTAVSVTVKGGGGTGGGACHVAYTITPQNTSAFGATLAITNNGTSTLSGWTLTWTFANGQTIANSWNGTETQSGATVSVSEQTGQTWQDIPPGGSYTGFGFNGTWNGTTNAIPTAFTLNGVACN